jgi:hypothetical protein
MTYTEQDVERVAEAIKRGAVDADGTYPMGTGRFYEAQARAALEAMQREPLPFPDMAGDRDALRELVYDDPILTDDQKREVYRIAEAIRVRVRSNYPELREIGDRPEAWEYPARILLGMVPTPMEREPLEDVLSPHEPMSVYLEPLYSGEIGARGCIDTWIAKVQAWDYANQTTETLDGRGDTIDEAIRNAVNN